jgi:glutamate synthase (NADPH/NADH) large chain
MILAPMAEDGEGGSGLDGRRHAAGGAVGAYRPLSHFFRQNFSQVTNPPIDSLREYRVMSLKTRFGNLKNVLDEDSSQTEILVLDSPFVGNAQFAEMVRCFGDGAVTIDCTFGRDEGAGALSAALARIRSEAEDAVRSGASHLILTDEHQGPERVPMPMILATGGPFLADPAGLADLLLAQRAVGRMHRPALFRGADRVRARPP